MISQSERLDQGWEEKKKKIRANNLLSTAVKDGVIDRPKTCELCSDTPSPIKVVWDRETTYYKSGIVGHHWRGYDHPLDVWFICHTCNVRLSGPEFHNGTVSKEEAREYVLNFQRKVYQPSQTKRCKGTLKGGDFPCSSYARKGGDYCQHHDPRKDDSQRCRGITKSGRRCQRNGSHYRNFCWLHSPNPN